jgi:hypothetical protein
MPADITNTHVAGRRPTNTHGSSAPTARLTKATHSFFNPKSKSKNTPTALDASEDGVATRTEPKINLKRLPVTSTYIQEHPTRGRPMTRVGSGYRSTSARRSTRSDSTSSTRTVRARCFSPPLSVANPTQTRKEQTLPLEDAPPKHSAVKSLADEISVLGSEIFTRSTQEDLDAKPPSRIPVLRKFSPPSLCNPATTRSEPKYSPTAANNSGHHSIKESSPKPKNALLSRQDMHVTSKGLFTHAFCAPLPACNDRLPADCAFLRPISRDLHFFGPPKIPALTPDFESGFVPTPEHLEEWHDLHWASRRSSYSKPMWTFAEIPDSLLPGKVAYEVGGDEIDEESRSIRRKAMDILKDNFGNVEGMGPEHLEMSVDFWDMNAPYMTFWGLRHQ